MQLSSDAPIYNAVVVGLKRGCISTIAHVGPRREALSANEAEVFVNPQTLFRIASVSKLVVAIAVMQQVERGVLGLDVDVSRYLGFRLRNPSFSQVPITLRMLLSHTSSVRDGDSYALPLGTRLQTEMQNIAHWDNAHAPGRYFSYENLNFGVIGTVLEAATHTRFDVLMQRTLLAPMKLHASFNVQGFADADFDNIATLYRKRGRDNEIWDSAGPWQPQAEDYKAQRPEPLLNAQALAQYVPGTNGTLFSPQGGLRISALGLAQLLQMLMNEGRYEGVQILKPSSIRTMLREQWHADVKGRTGATQNFFYESFGLGVQRFSEHITGAWLNEGDSKKPRQSWVGHFGDAYGLLAGMIWHPQRREGMIYLIGGVSRDPDHYEGKRSRLTPWEEDLLQATYQYGVSKP
jgi:CubicO group peptidase (beta-lactamase class C family)